MLNLVFAKHELISFVVVEHLNLAVINCCATVLQLRHERNTIVHGPGERCVQLVGQVLTSVGKFHRRFEKSLDLRHEQSISRFTSVSGTGLLRSGLRPEGVTSARQPG